VAHTTVPPRWVEPDDDPPARTATPDTTAIPPLAYQPALDGLRAVAVGAVLLYHGGVSWMQGGFLGVDLFFTLSGFLITSLLLREVMVGRVDYRRFWTRRLRRLFPALIAMLVLVAWYIGVFAPQSQRAQIRGDALATVAYVVNWRFVFTEASYFDQFLAPSPLRHAWSLAIEEQYYLLWPLLLTGLVLLLGRRLLTSGAVVALLGVVSMLWMWVLFDPAADPSRVYYGTDTRAQSVLVGAALAIALTRWPLRPSRAWTIVITVLGAVALVALATAWMRVGETDPALYRGGFFLHAVGSTAVILAAVLPGGNVVKGVLSISVLRWIGKVSYGLYLYHWPIFLIVNGERTGLSGGSLLAIRLIITGGVSVMSYVWLEEPIRSGARLTGRAAWIATPLAVVAVIALLIGASMRPVDAVVSRSVRPTTTSAPSSADSSVPTTAAPITVPVGVAVLGDSFAFDLGEGLQRLQAAGEPVVAVDAGRPGCGVARGGVIEADQRPIDVGGTCGDWREAWGDALAAQPEFALILSGAWEMTDRDLGNGMTRYGSPAHDEYLIAEFEAAIAFIRSNGVEPVLSTFPYVRLREYADGTEPPNNDPRRIRHFNRLLESIGAKTGTAVIDLNGFLAPNDEYTDVVDGVYVRAEDHAHFSLEGEEFIGRWVINELATLR